MDFQSVAVPAVTALVAFAGAWGLFRGKVTALEQRMDKVERANEKQETAITQATTELTKAAVRISDFAELKDTVVSQQVFDLRWEVLTTTLQSMQETLNRKVSLSTLAAARGELQPPEAPSAPVLPPMRPRAPSRPGR